MQNLGQTRSSNKPGHLLQTPDTFVRTALPGMRKATAIVHAAPALGARFNQYTAEFDAGGSMDPVSAQRFIYVLEGEVEVNSATLAAADYAYVPPRAAAGVSSKNGARAAIIEKLYQPLPGVVPPSFFTGRESDIAATFLMDDEALDVRVFLPDSPAFDFAVNTMTYLPGASLPMVEIHVMEHGLLMLEGGGIYRLGDSWYPVTKGDFIWMAPFCPQWFGAIGKTPAKYLVYKDWNRAPLDAAP
jgi:(S)-ureidoglycine aminohydrolase